MQVMRGAKSKGVRYFGPYSHAWAIRETLDLLLRVFPVRTCSAGVFKRAGQIGRPCLLGYIGKCSAPCVGRVSADEHRAHRRGLLRLHGRPDRRRFIRRLEREMRRAAEARSTSGRPGCATTSGRSSGRMEKQAVVLGDGTDADVIAFAEDPLEAAVQIFYVRGGRVRGQRGWVVDKVEDVDHRRAWSSTSSAVLRRRGADERRHPARGAGARAAARTPRRSTEWLGRLPRRPGCRCGCRSAATSGR